MTLTRSASLLACMFFLGACSGPAAPAPAASTAAELDSGVASAPSAADAEAPDAQTVDAIAPPASGPAFTVEPAALSLHDPAAPAGQSSSYTLDLDPATLLDGKRSARLESTDGTAKTSWGATTATHAVSASIAGRRYRMRARLKTEGATGAFLWWRIDGPGFFDLDNMGNPVDRRIKGTSDWQEVALVLDVPAGATGFAFGSGLVGHGKVWVGAFAFEPVGADVPTTPHFGRED